jgi:serine protease Do
MARTSPLLVLLVLHVVIPGRLLADEKPTAPPEKAPGKSVEQLAESARKSIAVILYTGRDGKRVGVGTGFVVSADGLIATNLHVIGEARPIAVKLADGKLHDVTTVHATDRAADLAVVRIDAKDLPALELGDSDSLKQGQAVVALGNPRGLERSVVSGVVSGRRTIEGQSMIQLAIPIEQGNSGGPLLDLEGRVHGVLTLKAALTANLGFATPSNALKPLLQKPNPVPMTSWLTIGALDPEEWKPLFGAHWRQRAGRIQVEGAGTGFGGRSLCLWNHPVPERPFEVAVTVKLDDEAGAAGLVFHADGEDKHYGFYPTGGQLRFVRFEGPDVYSWKILEQKTSPHYRPGDWNTLKVRIEKERILCYVNEQLVIESKDTGLTGGKVGLAKFRDTVADFKRFQVGEKVPSSAVPAEVGARITKAVENIAPHGPIEPKQVETLLPDAASTTVLRERARLLEQQAAQLRLLAAAVHQKRVHSELTKVLQGKEDDIDLLHAALLLAKLDNDELDVEAYRKEVERMGKDLAATLPPDADDKARLDSLNKYLFHTRGFHGSRSDYYHRSNSYLNEVIDDREGLPITLSVLYIDLARRIGLKVVGVALPGHFVVKHVPAKGEEQLIDVFEGGTMLRREDAVKRVEAATGKPFQDEYLAAATKQAIVVRMLHNLLGLAERDQDGDGMLRYLDAILAVAPSSHAERWNRALLRLRAGQRQGALEDTDYLLEHGPDGADHDRAVELRQLIQRSER